MADPVTRTDLLDRLETHAAHPAIVAFDGDERQWRYAELREPIDRPGRGLLRAGIEAGATAALCAPNSPEWIIAAFALVRLGAVPVPLDLRLGRRRPEHGLEDSACRFALSTSEAAPTLREHHPHRDRLKPIAPDRERPTKEDLPWWRDLLDGSERDFRRAQPDDTAVVFYTSGTTGAPEGVSLSHRNLVGNVRDLLAEDIVDRRERVLLPLPLHHVYPFTIGIPAPLAHCSAIVAAASDARRWDTTQARTAG